MTQMYFMICLVQAVFSLEIYIHFILGLVLKKHARETTPVVLKIKSNFEVFKNFHIFTWAHVMDACFYTARAPVWTHIYRIKVTDTKL